MVNKEKPLIQSLERALDIFDLLADEKAPLRSGEIAARLGLKSSTLNNMLRTLYRRGYLAQNEDGLYRLGARCYRLSRVCDRWEILRKLALPSMRELSEATGMGVFLGADGDGILTCVAQVDGKSNVLAVERQSWEKQFHSTAAGKVLLAHMPESDRNRILSGGLQAFTSHTLADRKSLKENLSLILEEGYALSREESVEEVAALGVPVTDNGICVAALGQSFPSYYLDSGKVDVSSHVALLRKHASLIAASVAAERARG